MTSKLVFKTGNGSIPTGNGINSHASYPQIWRKKFYYKMFIIFYKESKLVLKTITEWCNRGVFSKLSLRTFKCQFVN